MRNKKSNSFNHQVYQKTYRRIKLTPSQRMVFQRLLGFLIRNNKSFPFSAVTIADLTGLSLRTIFNILNDLENLRLITRVGLGKNRKFIRGSILSKILTTVQNRIKKELQNFSTTVQLTTQNSTNRATSAYKKTSSSLKRKDSRFSHNPEYQEYCTRISADINMKLISRDTKTLTFEEWLQWNKGELKQ